MVTAYIDLFPRGQRFNVASVALEHHAMALVAYATYRHQRTMDVSYLGFERDFMSVMSDCLDMFLALV